MTNLAEKFTTKRKPTAYDPVMRRRDRLVTAIEQQIAIISGQKVTQPQRPWAWRDKDGNLYLSIMYGRQELELSKGKYSISCSSLADVVETLGSVRDMVIEGKLDEQLQAIGTKLRARFEKKT